MKFIRSQRCAMTAIEVLAATTLSSLMLASVVGVLGTLARQQRALRASSAAPDWERMLIEQLRWDLTNSREFVASPTGVRLTGFAGRDFITGQPTGRPTEVDYYLVDAANDRWLVRRERHVDALHSGASRTDVVCRGVGKLHWGTNIVDQPTTNSSGVSFPRTVLKAPIPERIIVQLYGTSSGHLLVDEVLTVP